MNYLINANRYTGDICEKTACDENPCYLGATCISSPGTGFICICPLGMHGLRCEEGNTIINLKTINFQLFIKVCCNFN